MAPTSAQLTGLAVVLAVVAVAVLAASQERRLSFWCFSAPTATRVRR